MFCLLWKAKKQTKQILWFVFGETLRHANRFYLTFSNIYVRNIKYRMRKFILRFSFKVMKWFSQKYLDSHLRSLVTDLVTTKLKTCVSSGLLSCIYRVSNAMMLTHSIWFMVCLKIEMIISGCTIWIWYKVKTSEAN